MKTNKNAQERFFQSCKIGDLNTIKTDLFYNVSPFCQDKYGNNALHLACMYNQPKILEYLLKTVKTFKNDSKNKLGRTALNIAASQGAFECINILLNNLKCNINSTDKNFKNTPLHWCIISKCAKGTKQLLNSGADYMLINKFGNTPMQLAKTTDSNIYNLIDEFIKNKNQYLLNSSMVTNNDFNSELCSKPSRIEITDKSSKFNSKMYSETISQQNDVSETILEPDLSSNNSNDSFFLDISKLKHGDNSVLNLLEKSIEPVDETSFVSSILNSGKVIQLTEAGILALEYTKNEINTPIPNRLVKSFLTTSQQQNEINHDNNITSEKNNEFNIQTFVSGLKRLKSPEPCSKRFKYTQTSSSNISEFDTLLEQLNSKCSQTTKVCNSYHSQSSSSVENNTIENNYDCNKNQLVCFNSDINAQPKWVDSLMCLLNTLDNTNMEDYD